MVLTPAAHRLPNELIIAIIQAPSLTYLDLARLCLVSSQFLSTARQCLYQELEIETYLMDRSGVGQVEYSHESWLLLNTLKENPNLAKEVRSIVLEQEDPEPIDAEDIRQNGSEFELPSPEVVREVFALVPQVREVTLIGEWPGQLELIGHLRQLESLSIDHVGRSELVKIAKSFPHLKSLEFFSGELLRNRKLPRSAFPKLERLEVPLPFFIPRPSSFLLPATRSTLRYINLHLEILLDLDYSQFPHLQTIHIYYSDSGYVSYYLLQPHSSPGRFDRFFQSLAKAPKLDTLSFGPEEFHFDYEELLFSSERKGPILIRPVLERLKSIRFDEDVSLHRIAKILDAPWATNVRNIVVSPEYDWGDGYESRLEELRRLSSRRQIELVFDDYP